MQSTVDGLASALEEWFTAEDSEILCVDEIEMALEEQQLEQVDQTEMTFDEVNNSTVKTFLMMIHH